MINSISIIILSVAFIIYAIAQELNNKKKDNEIADLNHDIDSLNLITEKIQRELLKHQEKGYHNELHIYDKDNYVLDDEYRFGEFEYFTVKPEKNTKTRYKVIHKQKDTD